MANKYFSPLKALQFCEWHGYRWNEPILVNSPIWSFSLIKLFVQNTYIVLYCLIKIVITSCDSKIIDWFHAEFFFLLYQTLYTGRISLFNEKEYFMVKMGLSSSTIANVVDAEQNYILQLSFLIWS